MAEEENEVGIEMDEGYEVEAEDPQFALSFEYDATFRSHKAASTPVCFLFCLKTVYHFTLSGVYNFVVFLTGFFLILFWGTVNGLTIYYQSWCLSPLTTFTLVSCQGACLPCFEIMKHSFQRINELLCTLTRGCCGKSRVQRL